ncbi:MAG: uracil-DNA glycosylase [Symbiobacteriaceae bacterium]|nr:uracil-DNA glycosylase [Symbiobacteriaceae bacterium]
MEPEKDQFLEDMRWTIDWAALKLLVLNCQRCSLRQGCTQVVFGAGNEQAKLLVIGEGPGADEDQQGEPFVGAAGRLLDNILQTSGFSRRSNVYIANIVKCRPPGNRVPTPEERERCLPILREQFRRLRPKIVLLLGATAIQSILGTKEPIGKVRGTWQERGGVLFMPTYHPAALLRNPNWKKDVWEDMKEVVRLYRELVDPEHFPELKL